MANHPREQEKTSWERQDPYEIANQRDGSVGNRGGNMVTRTVLLVNEEEGQRWLEEKNNGSIWQGDGRILASEIDASIKGWEVVALKIVFKSPDGKDGC